MGGGDEILKDYWIKNKDEYFEETGFDLEFVKETETSASYWVSPKMQVIMDTDLEYHSSGDASIRTLFKNMNVFVAPKPVELIRKLIEITMQSSESIILDFFAGSGTTAQAVMELNAERTENILETIKMDSLSDGSAQRALSPARESNLNKNKPFSAPAKADNSANALRYILVQLDESVKEGSEAEKAGYKTIDEISRERIKRAAEKIGDKSGFKSFFLKTPSADTLDKIDEFIPDENLISGDMINPFSAKSLGAKGNADGKDVLLSTWLLDDGFTFDEKIEEIKFAEALGYYIGRRLYILDDKWNTESAKALLNLVGKNELLLQTIIVYAYSLNFETLLELKTNLKTNLAEDKKIEIIERF